MSSVNFAHTSSHSHARLSLPTLDGAGGNNRFSKRGSIFHRAVVMDEEDSRECPSQGANELAREDFFLRGFDEIRGQGLGLPLQPTSPGSLQYRPVHHHRVSLRRHSTDDFRERRDSNSFDSCDSDSDDDSIADSIAHRDLLPFRPQGKMHFQNASTISFHNTFKPRAPVAIVDVDNNKNKRKTPSPVVGEEPAPVSVAPMTDNSMDTEDGTLHTQETCDITDAGYDSADNNMPSPGRRVSLSPVSRRLAIQFDSISFLSPVKPSQAKRRKTFDTSASCL